MTDYLIEQLVKQNKTKSTVWKQAGLILATILAGYLMLAFHPMFGLLLLAMILADVILFRRMKLEFEYSYFEGDLDIDKIMNMTSRKRVFSTSVKDMELIAPTGAPQLRPYQDLKVLDCSSNTEDILTYEIVGTYKGNKMRVIFEPNDKMLSAMRDLSPRKVFTN